MVVELFVHTQVITLHSAYCNCTPLQELVIKKNLEWSACLSFPRRLQTRQPVCAYACACVGAFMHV